MGERSAEHPSERRGAEGIARAESAGGDRDLERVLRDALSRLARSAECDAAVVWRRGADRDALALDASAESPVPGSADAYTELAHLARATDLEGTGSARLGAIARDYGFSAAAPVGRRGAEAPAVLLVRGPRDGSGRVRPRMLGALDAAARQLEPALAASASLARLHRLDARVQELDRLAMLGELLTEVAHEIRNPLVSVKTFLQLLPDRVNDPEFRTKFVGLVEEELRRIERLLDAVLAHARPPSAPRADARVAVAPVLESIAFLLGHRAVERDVRIEVDTPPALPDAGIGPDELRQVVLNLTLNAIDATRPRGAVRLRALAAGDRVAVIVEDEGEGIARELRERVFEPFFSTKSDRPGGLGLAICRRIVEQAGGDIALEDRPRGGCAFRIRLASAGESRLPTR